MIKLECDDNSFLKTFNNLFMQKDLINKVRSDQYFVIINIKINSTEINIDINGNKNNFQLPVDINYANFFFKLKITF